MELAHPTYVSRLPCSAKDKRHDPGDVVASYIEEIGISPQDVYGIFASRFDEAGEVSEMTLIYYNRKKYKRERDRLRGAVPESGTEQASLDLGH